MQKQILTFINDNQLFTHSDKLLLAVSGGKDSMAMLHALQQLKFDVSVAHCNFQLRGIAADDDEKFVKDYCERNKIQFFAQKFETKKVAKSENISTQMAARNLRYAWFETIRKSHNFNYILTAHHLGDVVETLLFNISKGTGPVGLKSIPAKTLAIVRPLLSVNPHQILDYLKLNNLNWREDASNLESNYARNKIRNKVVPILQEINEGLFSTVQNNVKRFEDLNLIFEQQMADFEKRAITVLDNCIEIKLIELQNTMGKGLILEEYLKPYGFNFSQVNDLIHIKNVGRKIESNNYEIIVANEKLILAEKKSEVIDFEINNLGEFEINGKKLLLDVIEEFPSIENLKNASAAYLNFEQIQWPLKLRNWQPNDKFKPYGMKGNKLVSDYLIDEKVNSFEKKTSLVLCDKNEIIWLVNKRINDNFKINKSTQKVLKVLFFK